LGTKIHIFFETAKKKARKTLGVSGNTFGLFENTLGVITNTLGIS
jgi:hypothetical protein